ncbi:hypothetical protein Chor_006703 [Crotalus horridus]
MAVVDPRADEAVAAGAMGNLLQFLKLVGQLKEAMKHLTRFLSEDVGKEIYELWEEYECQSTAEAKFVKQLDQCEMIIQALEYEELEKRPGRLQDFYDTTAGKFSHPEIVQLVSSINRERNANIAAENSDPPT